MKTINLAWNGLKEVRGKEGSAAYPSGDHLGQLKWNNGVSWIVIDSIELVDALDKLIWGLMVNKRFTTRSMYSALTFRGVIDINMQDDVEMPTKQLKRKRWGRSLSPVSYVGR